MKKSDLRTLYMERRRLLYRDQLAEASRKIADLLFESVDFKPFRYLHCYLPIEKFCEIDTTLIFQRVWREYPQLKTIVPRVDFKTGEIEGVPYTAESELFQNKWGIKEPAACDKVDDALIDTVFVPLLCFDERGYRVGYGRGYYDRFLARCRNDCKKIGLSIFEPVKAIEDVAEHDIALDLFIMPEGLFQPRRN